MSNSMPVEADRDPAPVSRPGEAVASADGAPAGIRANVGCGRTPTPGFVNLDNSLSVRLARRPILVSLLGALRLLGKEQRAFIAGARASGIRWATAEHLPFGDATVSILYSSHMVEHLTREEASRFFLEAFRVMRPGGWIRIAVPDLRRKALDYIQGALDADAFVDSTSLAYERPLGLFARAKAALVGFRHHLWMYDGGSLGRLLERHGFVDAAEVPLGETRIPGAGAMDLAERASESVYVEARKP